jgi:hypothetical protein
MVEAIWKTQDPPDDGYLTAADIAPGEHTAFIRDWESRGNKTLARYLRGFKKPALLNEKTINALGRVFKETNWELWFRREVILSTSGTNISVKGVHRYEPPAPKPTNDTAGDLAAVLMRAIAAPHDRANIAKILREVSSWLAVNKSDPSRKSRRTIPHEPYR